jgi:2-polyprenyl-3-methyl-5-hydroxy-6-metoxy-1,4-benzoquinol methylase
MKRPDYISFIKQNRTAEQAVEIYEQRIADALHIFDKFFKEFEIRDCPICGGNESVDIEKFHNTYGVQNCSACQTSFVNPCPPLKALEYYYNECKCNALLGSLYRNRHQTGNIILSERVQFLIKLIENEFANKEQIRILEIGCSSGAFLSELKESLAMKGVGVLSKCKLVGIDIDETAVKKNVDSSIEILAVGAEEYAKSSKEKYDLIIHFELIEHLQNPFSFMQSVAKLLTPNGLHHFHTPNANGFDNQALGYNKFRALAILCGVTLFSTLSSVFSINSGCFLS